MIAALIAASLIALHTPPHARIDLNPAQIVMLREPRDHETLLSQEAECIVLTVDGKFVAVVETCDQVRALLAGH
jgi:hypothetical protein